MICSLMLKLQETNSTINSLNFFPALILLLQTSSVFVDEDESDLPVPGSSASVSIPSHASKAQFKKMHKVKTLDEDPRVSLFSLREDIDGFQ